MPAAADLSFLSLYAAVTDNKLGSFIGSWNVDLSPVQFRGSLDLQDLSGCKSDSKPWFGSGSLGFQLPSSCLELQADLTYYRCAKEGEPLVTVVSARPSSFFLGGVGVDYAEVNMSGMRIEDVWHWNGTVQGVLAASLGEPGAGALGVKVHILNNAVAQFEVGFRYNSSFLGLDGDVFVNAQDCSAGGRYM